MDPEDGGLQRALVPLSLRAEEWGFAWCLQKSGMSGVLWLRGSELQDDALRPECIFRHACGEHAYDAGINASLAYNAGIVVSFTLSPPMT